MTMKKSKKNNRSKKHHYLPRYYLEGFTNSQNLLYVYDKQEDRILPDPLPPGNLFFMNDLNTIVLENGEKSDSLEKLYTKTENSFWKTLDRIRESQPQKAIELPDKMHLFNFLLILHWRLPSNSKHIDKLSNEIFNMNGELPFVSLTDKQGQDAPEEVKAKLRESPAFKKNTRLIAPFAPFIEKNWSDQLRNWKFLYAGDGSNWNLVGDNPIVTRSVYDHDLKRCLNEFIFPISGRIMVVATDKSISKTLPPEFLIQLGSGMIKRAKRFVAHGRRDFLEAIISDYKLHTCFEKEEEHIVSLFSMLEN